jgi:hypothetical protein
MIRALLKRARSSLLAAAGATAASRVSQVLLYQQYREMAARGVVPSFAEAGFRVTSQFEEDGILLLLFAVLGTTNRKVVEVCAGDGTECMSANLVLNHGWWGYLFDGDTANVAAGRAFFKRSRDTWLHPPRFERAWITAENANDVIRGAGVEGPIDLLSIDVDGMDYWIWKAIDCVRPRVVVCETHNIIPPELALTVPYDPKFRITTPGYHSASLAAMTSLARQKGYRLVGTHRYGFNAFFVAEDLAPELLPAGSPAQCLADPSTLEARATHWPRVKDMNWVQV